VIVIFAVLMTSAVNTTLFWIVTQCTLVDVYRRFKCIIIIITKLIELLLGGSSPYTKGKVIPLQARCGLEGG